MIDELDVDVVRHDLSWATIQPGPNTFIWDTYDGLVVLSQRHHFDLLPILDYNTGWTSDNRLARSPEDVIFSSPPPEAFGWFAYLAVARYKDHMSAWQVWNEPNVSLFWRPEPDPVAYADLLKHAYYAIKYADPAAVVVMAGLANDASHQVPEHVWYPPEAFLEAVYDAGAGAAFDAAARHPYTHPFEGTRGLRGRLEALRAVMESHGDHDKPIWVTEYGYSALPAARVSDDLQATWLVRSLDAALALDYVPTVLLYNFREKGRDPNDWEHNYGLVEHDWRPKPAYEAVRTYIAGEGP
jgi:hypothetical protein